MPHTGPWLRCRWTGVCALPEVSAGETRGAKSLIGYSSQGSRLWPPRGLPGSLLSAANLCLGCRPEPRVERERKRRIPAPGCEAKGVIKRRVASRASEAGGSRANRVGPSAPASCTRGPSREGQLPGRARPSHLLHTSQVSILPQEGLVGNGQLLRRPRGVARGLGAPRSLPGALLAPASPCVCPEHVVTGVLTGGAPRDAPWASGSRGPGPCGEP